MLSAKIHPPVYEVTFYRELLGDSGKRFDSPLSTFRVEATGGEADTLLSAIKRFERQNKLESWRSLATGFKMSLVG